MSRGVVHDVIDGYATELLELDVFREIFQFFELNFGHRIHRTKLNSIVFL